MANRETTARNAQMIADRESGMTYQQIGEKHGVSRQYVGNICGRCTPYKFRYVTENGCVYPNLRKWMNDNKVTRTEFVRRLGLINSPNHYSMRVRDYMTGRCDPPKWMIDRMLDATNLTYEQLFYREDET